MTLVCCLQPLGTTSVQNETNGLLWGITIKKFLHFLLKIAILQTSIENARSTLKYNNAMRRYTLLAVLAIFLLCCCENDGWWRNHYDTATVYIDLKGGEATITAEYEIVYTGVQMRDIDGEWHRHFDYDRPDPSSWPYKIETEWCTIEHISARKMNITVLPAEQRREIFINLGGIDKRGNVHRAPNDFIIIYQRRPLLVK